MTTKRLLRMGAAELVGTIVLASVVAVLGFIERQYIQVYLPVIAPLLIGSVVMVLVYLFGGVSGAHFNPSVTLAMVAYRRMPWKQGLVYLIAQILGAFIGLQLVGRALFIGYEMQSALTTTIEWRSFFAEALGAAILLMGVTTVVIGKVKEELSGLVIGSSLTIGITLAMVSSGAILNPSLALAMFNFNLSYLVAPLIGGLVGAGIVLAITGKHE